MMKKLFIMGIVTTILLVVGCSKEYDDEKVRDSIASLEQRVLAMETILRAYENNLFIETVTPIENGYVIAFSDGSHATIVNGHDGENYITSISIEQQEVIFVLTSGETFSIPLVSNNSKEHLRSVNFISRYDDNKAQVCYSSTSKDSHIILDFWVTPKEYIQDLATIENEVMAVKAVYTESQIVDFVELSILSIETDTVNGVVTITVSGQNLSKEFFEGAQSAKLFLTINDIIVSDFIKLVPIDMEEIIFQDTHIKNICISNWDTNGDGKFSYNEAASVTSINNEFNGFLITDIYGGEHLVSVGNQSIISFDELQYFTSLKTLPSTLFSNNINMISVTLPHGLTTINGSSSYQVENFYSYGSNGFVSIELAPFSYTQIREIILPETIEILNGKVFYGASFLCKLYCKAVTPPTNYTSLGLNNDCVIYVPRASVDAYKVATGWHDYADKIVGYDFE